MRINRCFKLDLHVSVLLHERIDLLSNVDMSCNQIHNSIRNTNAITGYNSSILWIFHWVRHIFDPLGMESHLGSVHLQLWKHQVYVRVCLHESATGYKSKCIRSILKYGSHKSHERLFPVLKGSIPHLVNRDRVKYRDREEGGVGDDERQS